MSATNFYARELQEDALYEGLDPPGDFRDRQRAFYARFSCSDPIAMYLNDVCAKCGRPRYVHTVAEGFAEVGTP